MSDNSEIIELLQRAYSHELEVVTNFIANSTNLDGIRAEEIKKALAADVAEELLNFGADPNLQESNDADGFSAIMHAAPTSKTPDCAMSV